MAGKNVSYLHTEVTLYKAEMKITQSNTSMIHGCPQRLYISPSHIKTSCPLKREKNNRPKTRNKNNIINEKNTHHYQPIGRNNQDWPLPACGSIYKGGLDPYCNFQVSAHQRKPTAACNLVLQTRIFILRSTTPCGEKPKIQKAFKFSSGNLDHKYGNSCHMSSCSIQKCNPTW